MSYTILTEPITLKRFINNKNIEGSRQIYIYYKTNLILIVHADRLKLDNVDFGSCYVYEWEYSSGIYFVDVLKTKRRKTKGIRYWKG